MKIVIFTHPSFLASQSMPRYSNMLAEGMKELGHHVEIWSPKPKLYNLSVPLSMKKWLGYIDQYILFPKEISIRLKKSSKDTIFVFADHALGPWVPSVRRRPHIIHCHDFLAQRSASGEIAENKTSISGRIYQAYIRKGYKKGRNFVSVSQNTRLDLHLFLGKTPVVSEVVYNAINKTFIPYDAKVSREMLAKRTLLLLENGYILHVGGNQWYKNRCGVIDIYNAWRSTSKQNLPLLLIGPRADENLLRHRSNSSFKEDIHLLDGIEDEFISFAYSGARVFIFPSLAEGFGWPIAEAMASGVPVLTTNEAPMNEVAGGAAVLIPRKPIDDLEKTKWAELAAIQIERIVTMPESNLSEIKEKGYQNTKRFEKSVMINKLEDIYKKILKNEIMLMKQKSDSNYI